MDMETSYLLKDITIENITSNREQDSSETSQFVATFVSTDVMISLLQRYASENNLDYDSLCFTYRDKIVTRTGSEYIDFVLDPSKNCSINHFRASMIAQAGNHHLVCLYKSNLRTLQEYPNLFTRVVDGHHPDAIRDYLMTMPTSEAVSELDELGREMDGGATPLLTLVDNSWKSEEASLLTLLEFINDLDGITDLDGNRMREQRPEIEVSEFTMPTRRPHAPGFVSFAPVFVDVLLRAPAHPEIWVHSVWSVSNSDKWIALHAVSDQTPLSCIALMIRSHPYGLLQADAHGRTPLENWPLYNSTPSKSLDLLRDCTRAFERGDYHTVCRLAGPSKPLKGLIARPRVAVLLCFKTIAEGGAGAVAVVPNIIRSLKRVRRTGGGYETVLSHVTVFNPRAAYNMHLRDGDGVLWRHILTFL